HTQFAFFLACSHSVPSFGWPPRPRGQAINSYDVHMNTALPHRYHSRRLEYSGIQAL
ncbi:unnamed protein product, partial [Ectocarpus sp. 8 AP-2014]